MYRVRTRKVQQNKNIFFIFYFLISHIPSYNPNTAILSQYLYQISRTVSTLKVRNIQLPNTAALHRAISEGIQPLSSMAGSSHGPVPPDPQCWLEQKRSQRGWRLQAMAYSDPANLCSKVQISTLFLTPQGTTAKYSLHWCGWELPGSRSATSYYASLQESPKDS